MANEGASDRLHAKAPGAETQSDGIRIYGPEVQWTYTPASLGTNGILSCKLQDDSESIHIDGKDVIACIPISRVAQKDGPSIVIFHLHVSSDNDLPILRQSYAHELPVDFLRAYEARPDNAFTYSNNTGGAVVHVIVSTASGTKNAQTFFEQVVQPILSCLDCLQPRVTVTSSAESVADLMRDEIIPAANKGASQKIVLLSGDGAVNDVVNTLHSGERSTTYQAPCISVLPFGTGNAIYNSYCRFDDATMGLSTLFRGQKQELPTFKVTYSAGARLLEPESHVEKTLHLSDNRPTIWGAVVCSWGLHASLVSDSDTAEARQHGSVRFKMAANALLYPDSGAMPHEYQGEIAYRSLDGSWHKIDRKAHGYVLATLVSDLEKGFTISPSSHAQDKHMRLIEFAPCHGDEVMTILKAAYDGGKHIGIQQVGYHELTSMCVEDIDEAKARWRMTCVDGHIIAVKRGGWFRVDQSTTTVVDIICRHER